MPRTAVRRTSTPDAITLGASDQRFWTRYHNAFLVFALALALRSIFALLTADTYDYDEFVLLLLARDFAHGAVPYHDFMFFHPPGPLVILRALEPLTNVWWPTARMLMILVDSATAVLVWHIGTLLFDRRGALAAGLLYAISPLALISAVRIGQDPLITALSVAGIALLLSRSSHRAAALAGVCLGLAIWIKYPAAVVFPVYLAASPRRAFTCGASAALTLGLLFAPFLPHIHELYDQTVTFQRTRWAMPLDQRLETTLLFWLGVNVLAVLAVFQRRYPAWLIVGFATGGIFVFSSQVYYHYFAPVVPFAALLAAPLIVDLSRTALGALVGGAVALTLLWATLIDLGGPSPVFVTAAHLSSIHPTIQLVDRSSRPSDYVLADRYEYAYLARRLALAHYFWNVGVLKDAQYLERRLPGATAVVLSYGASSGYPAGFTDFLDQRYPRINTRVTTVWLLRRTSAHILYLRFGH